MSNAIPLLVAFLGALFGTYFALLKSRRERLWLDRYETLLKVVDIAEIVKSRFLALQADELGLDAFSDSEIEAIEDSWKSARINLNTLVTRARLLWKQRAVLPIVNAHQDLDRAILEVLGKSQPDQNAALNDVWLRTNELIDCVIGVAHKTSI